MTLDELRCEAFWAVQDLFNAKNSASVLKMVVKKHGIDIVLEQTADQDTRDTLDPDAYPAIKLAQMYLIARDEGMSAALMWKLANA